MPRSLWSGSISFGLVNVPVRLYSAVKEHKLQFHFVHEKDNSPIGYEKICKKENKPVPVDEIKASRARVSQQELEMAGRLIESFTGKWKPEQYKDTYRDELCAIIRAKRRGEKIHAAPELAEEAPTDLMTALRESIERSR